MAVSQLTTASMLHLMQEDDRPEKEIFDAVGDLSGFEWADNFYLLGIYVQQGKTKGGLITNVMSKVSIYQGKVGLVLKLPMVPLPESEVKAWGGAPPKVGEWVVFNPNDGWQLSVSGPGGKVSERLGEMDLGLYAGWPCRLIESRFIMGRVKNPRSVV